MDDEAPKTLLITLTGKDRPGVTSVVFSTLAAFGVAVLDIEQIVLRRRLVLGVLVTVPRDWKALRDAMERVAAELDMQVDVDRGLGDNREHGAGRSHVTLLGAPLKASALAAIAGRIADCGANIDRVERMARYPVTAIDLAISMVDLTTLEGADTQGKVRNLCRKAMLPDPEFPDVPRTAAVCVYPDLAATAVETIKLRATRGRVAGRRVMPPPRPVVWAR